MSKDKKLQRKRKTITAKIRLEVITRDNFTCRNCGRSPVTYPGLSLEVDHIEPFALNGADALDNFQTLCQLCNRGKGCNPNLNRTIKNELDILLNKINPEIFKNLKGQNCVSVVANQEDYTKLCEKNSLGEYYKLTPSTNTIMGLQTGKGLGLYTIHDNSGSKVHFFIEALDQ